MPLAQNSPLAPAHAVCHQLPAQPRHYGAPTHPTFSFSASRASSRCAAAARFASTAADAAAAASAALPCAAVAAVSCACVEACAVRSRSSSPSSPSAFSCQLCAARRVQGRGGTALRLAQVCLQHQAGSSERLWWPTLHPPTPPHLQIAQHDCRVSHNAVVVALRRRVRLLQLRARAKGEGRP